MMPTKKTVAPGRQGSGRGDSPEFCLEREISEWKRVTAASPYVARNSNVRCNVNGGFHLTVAPRALKLDYLAFDILNVS